MEYYQVIKKTDGFITKPNFQNEGPSYLEHSIIGNSDETKSLRSKIISSARSNCVFFISGENGCEKTAVAWNLHHLGSSKKGNFVTIPSTLNSPKNYRECLVNSLDDSINGTLFIKDVGSLKKEFRDELILFLISKEIVFSKEIKLIISSESALKLNSELKSFIYDVVPFWKLIFNIHIPPLRDRKEDIESHIHYIGNAFNRKVDITQSALNILKSYDWPENIEEFHRNFHTLLFHSSEKITEKEIKILNIEPSLNYKKNDDVCNYILNNKGIHYKNLHPGLLKALNYLRDNFQKDISLSELASNAFLSTSHLSYLFRRYLNTSFKCILCQVRIKFAKNVMADFPCSSITNIALQSGFGDLSHFEKMFRRHVGCTPKSYRAQYRSIQITHSAIV